MHEAGFGGVDACVLRIQNTSAQYIAMRHILDLCKETVQIPGMWVVKRWWEKELLYLVGAWEVMAASEEEVEAEETEGEAEGVSGKQIIE